MAFLGGMLFGGLRETQIKTFFSNLALKLTCNSIHYKSVQNFREQRLNIWKPCKLWVVGCGSWVVDRGWS